MPTDHSLDDLILEKDLLDWLGVKRSTLDRFRREGLPVCPLDKTHRAYWKTEITSFLREKTTKTPPPAPQAE